MVGPSKNSSSLISRTNVHMHTNADILEIRQIEGLRVAKVMRRIVTQIRVAMELEGTMAGAVSG